MKDLTFIAEGNPDFFKGGLINLTKRRQVNDIFIYIPWQCIALPQIVANTVRSDRFSLVMALI